MAQKVRYVMTPAPVALARGTPVADAAQIMRDQAIGDVLVNEGDRLGGMVTDRDIVTRAVAGQQDLRNLTLGEICSSNVITVSPDEDAEAAVQLMRRNAVRRIPVVENGAAIGIISIGDMAIERGEHTALADISAAPPNG